MTSRGYWEISYQVFVDGEPVTYVTNWGDFDTMEIIGTSKKNAYTNQFEDQWRLIKGDDPIPKRSRIKLQEIDRVAWGAI